MDGILASQPPKIWSLQKPTPAFFTHTPKINPEPAIFFGVLYLEDSGAGFLTTIKRVAGMRESGPEIKGALGPTCPIRDDTRRF